MKQRITKLKISRTFIHIPWPTEIQKVVMSDIAVFFKSINMIRTHIFNIYSYFYLFQIHFQEEETSQTKDFRKMFSPYDFTLE